MIVLKAGTEQEGDKGGDSDAFFSPTESIVHRKSRWGLDTSLTFTIASCCG